MKSIKEQAEEEFKRIYPNGTLMVDEKYSDILIRKTKEQYKEEIGSILTRLLMWSQITFDNKSIIFENKIKEFDEICKDLKQLKKKQEIKNGEK